MCSDYPDMEQEAEEEEANFSRQKSDYCAETKSKGTKPPMPKSCKLCHIV